LAVVFHALVRNIPPLGEYQRCGDLLVPHGAAAGLWLESFLAAVFMRFSKIDAVGLRVASADMST
jgi:hypothetical protein